MRERDQIIAEIKRIATLLASGSVSQRDFEEHATMSVSGVAYVFGSWNRAVEAAGLVPNESGLPKVRELIPDAELMEEIIRVTIQLRKRPSDHEMGSFGKFSPRPYVKRWGTFAKGREAAYQALGFPDFPDTGNE